MKRIKNSLAITILILSALACSRADVEFYISPEGNDHVIMYNEIFDAVRDFFDAGAINCHLGYDPTQRGTLISSNYFHEIGMKMEGCKCIYTDGASFEVTVEKNIFQNI